MTYGDLVHTIFLEFVAGAEMEDEVPDHVLHPGELPRMEAGNYLQSKGVGVSGQDCETTGNVGK